MIGSLGFAFGHCDRVGGILAEQRKRIPKIFCESHKTKTFPIIRIQAQIYLAQQSRLDPTMNDNTKAAATPIPEEFKLIHRFWQASNYLSVGQVRTCTTTLPDGICKGSQNGSSGVPVRNKGVTRIFSSC
jgi:hypothetical protein